MRQPQASAGLDRLPWLDDEPAPRTKRRASVPWLWAIAAAMLVIAGASYWMGANSGQEPPIHAQRAAPSSTTVSLPEPKPAQSEVKLDPMPEVEPVVAPTVRPAPQRQVPLHRPQSIAPAPVSAPPIHVRAAQQSVTLWPARQAAGASGRLVRIGAFGSRLQAKRGWAAMARAYPAMRRLPAVVVETRNSKGRGFYRFQIGTSSQAHSEILCQRMQAIHFSCAVVGLPWKPRGVER